MRFSINLRGDLAKLSDADLAERLEATWQAYESVKRLGGLGFGGLPSGQRPAELFVGGRGAGVAQATDWIRFGKGVDRLRKWRYYSHLPR